MERRDSAGGIGQTRPTGVIFRGQSPLKRAFGYFLHERKVTRGYIQFQILTVDQNFSLSTNYIFRKPPAKEKDGRSGGKNFGV